MAYLILLAYILIVLALLRSYKSAPNAELLFICIGLFVFFAFRSPEVGTDTIGYCNLFMSMERVSSISKIMGMQTTEKGFYIFIWLLYRIAPFRQALLIAHSAFLVYCVYRFFKRFSSDYLVSIVCFLTISMKFHLTGMRQSLAMCICMLAYIKLVDKKYLSFFLLTALAFTFHNSAIVFVMAFVFGVIWKKGNNLITTGILSLVFALSADVLLPMMSLISPKWEDTTIEATGNGFTFFAVLIVMELLFALQQSKMGDETKFHIRTSYMAVILWAGRLITRTFERPALFFFPTFAVAMPDVLKAFRPQERRIIYFAYLSLMSLLYIWRTYSGEYSLFF